VGFQLRTETVEVEFEFVCRKKVKGENRVLMLYEEVVACVKEQNFKQPGEL
jgi:hypothetical protein